jgi:hypothetical protein
MVAKRPWFQYFAAYPELGSVLASGGIERLCVGTSSTSDGIPMFIAELAAFDEWPKPLVHLCVAKRHFVDMQTPLGKGKPARYLFSLMRYGPQRGPY